MNRLEIILKSKLDELSQDNGSYPSFKHTDRELIEYILEAKEEAILEFIKWKDDNYCFYKWSDTQTLYMNVNTLDMSNPKTIKQLIEEWNELN